MYQKIGRVQTWTESQRRLKGIKHDHNSQALDNFAITQNNNDNKNIED